MAEVVTVEILTPSPKPKAKNLKGVFASRFLQFDLCKAKAVSGGADDPGYLEGYAAAFGNVDLGGERLIAGCFSNTLGRVESKQVPLLSRHMAYGGDTPDIIGQVQSAREDAYGLMIKAPFAKTEGAQDARQLCVDGMVGGLSIGYQIMRYEPVTENENLVYDIKEVKLWEVTLTAFPMNPAAMITAAKSFNDHKLNSHHDTSLLAAVATQHQDGDAVISEWDYALRSRQLDLIKARSAGHAAYYQGASG